MFAPVESNRGSFAVQFLLPVLCCLIFQTFANEGDPLDSVDLSGTWSFTPSGQAQTTIKVPGGGWYKQGFTAISEADYSRSISIPNSGQAQVTKIEFGAVNYQAALYINTQLVGTNLTAWTPSVFEISGFVTPGQTYTLRVHVKGRQAFMVNGKSTVPNAAGWSPNLPDGIFRSASIKVYPQIYISDCFVRPSVKNKSLSFDVWVTNATGAPHSMTVGGVLSSWNKAAFAYPAIADRSITIASGSTQKITVGPLSWTADSSSYWWPNVPYKSGYTAQLHNLTISLKEGGTSVHSKTVRFGFRQVEQKSDGSFTYYYLNGIRVNFRGENLQGVNYDAITYAGGKGDAYDTYPGFLPGDSGWSKAVDNYQRLNYNFVRLHQEPVTPYMLDVCDEKGQMLMVETAIRGSEGSQDFTAGHDNMVNHCAALLTRDRNHPAVVRWSQANEPGGDAQFEVDLYNAAMAVDSTRPISVDGTTFNTLTYSNFSTYVHYGNGFAHYTDNVFARPDQPFGEGEFIWYADNTIQGFTWFATSTQTMRRENASDIRPYTLLSAWCSFIPGVNHTDMEIEQGYKNNGSPNPLYGEDNLSDPWNNHIVKRNQAAFNPVLVADSAFWERNELSDANGNWPSAPPEQLKAGQAVTRTLIIYNDDFSNTKVDVYWELHNGSVAGTINTSGELHPIIPLGFRTSQKITFTPAGTSDTVAYLVLISKMNGVEIFRETEEIFAFSDWTMVDDADSAISYSPGSGQAGSFRYVRYLGPAGSYCNIAEMEFYDTASTAKLTGMAFGSSPSYSAGTEFNKASDGSTTTFFDNAGADGGYTGIDLGSAKKIVRIRFWPRTGFEYRMDGGKFQGSTASTGSGFTDISTISDTPQTSQWSTIEPYGWSTDFDPRYYESTEHAASTSGSIATFSFKGVGAKYYGCKRNDLGMVEVSMDGAVKATVDCYASGAVYDVPLYQINGLPNSQHTISLRVTGQKNALSVGTSVIIDAFSYLPPNNTDVIHSNQKRPAIPGVRTQFRVLGLNLVLPAEFEGKDVSIDIVDLHGRVVNRARYLSGKLSPMQKNGPMGPGIYFARWTDGVTVTVKRLQFEG